MDPAATLLSAVRCLRSCLLLALFPQALDVCIALLEPRLGEAAPPPSPPTPGTGGSSPRGPGLVSFSSGEFRRISLETTKGTPLCRLDCFA